jgi:hypothetical protein
VNTTSNDFAMPIYSTGRFEPRKSKLSIARLVRRFMKRFTNSISAFR